MGKIGNDPACRVRKGIHPKNDDDGRIRRKVA